MVMIQASTMLCVTFQRTAETRRAAPTPMMQPVIVCVVETGMPRWVAANRVIAPPVSAQNPWTGVSRVIFEPMVRTMRQPPVIACYLAMGLGTPSLARETRRRDSRGRTAKP